MAKIERTSGKQAANKGQGVVEYAGALVIAASIVAMALSFVPEEVMAFWGDIIDMAGSFMNGQLPG